MTSLGKDLASIRKERQISLEEVHSITKIPLDTLKSIEDGSLFEDASQQHQTYVRSFVRSFGKALKISDDALVDALNKYEQGTYKDDLLSEAGLTPSSIPLFELDSPSNEPKESTPPPEPPKEIETEQTDSKKEYEVAPSPPTVDTVNWADMGKKFGVAEVKSRLWILIVCIIILVSIGIGIIFFWDDIMNQFSSDTDPITSAPTEELSTPESTDNVDDRNEALEITEPNNGTLNTNNTIVTTPTLQELEDTLSLVVYAAFGVLEPVRVTSDITWRTNPYWVEELDAYSFAFQDTILVRGQYNRMLLMLNGHVIENARQLYFDDEFDSIMLTRSIFENDSTFIQPVPSVFPYSVGAPVEIINP